MDKETLSNYGWVVVCILVLCVMIALATPFGKYISLAVQSTTQGLYATNQKAMNTNELVQMEDNQLLNPDTIAKANIKRETGTLIPTGAKYTKADGTTLEGNGTNVFPDAPATNDTYKEGDYIYTYNSDDIYGNEGAEWSVKVKSTEKTSYGDILSRISDKPVTHMSRTFRNCTNLINAPVIPSSVTYMYQTFQNCTSLKNVINISENIKTMYYTFENCSSLAQSPTIPNNAGKILGLYKNCSSLKVAPKIPDNITKMNYVFYGCSSLTTAPAIPNKVENLTHTFEGCSSLVKMPNIPQSVNEMDSTFADCTSLITLSTLPDNVLWLNETFKNCVSLTTAPNIPQMVEEIEEMFSGCKSLKGEITFNTNSLTNITNCFKDTKQAIIITGSSSKLTELAATANNGNVTVK